MSDGLDYDPDTTGDFDETTLDGSEGLDGDFLTGDGENYVMDPPDRWRGASPHDTLGKRLAEEKPDIDVDDDLDDDPEMRYGDVDGHERSSSATMARATRTATVGWAGLLTKVF